MLRRSLLAAALTLALASAAHAAPTATPIATVATSQAPIAAYGGWVAWSEPDAEGKWSVWTWHAGERRRLDLQRRDVPFDLDVGPGPDGTPTVAFSWCAKDPDPAPPFGVLPGATAQRCGLYAIDLVHGIRDGIPSVVVPRSERGSSLSTPSLWGNRIAYQERVAGTPVTRMYLYDRRTKKRTGATYALVGGSFGKEDGSGQAAAPLTLALLHGVTYDHTDKRAGEPFLVER